MRVHTSNFRVIGFVETVASRRWRGSQKGRDLILWTTWVAAACWTLATVRPAAGADAAGLAESGLGTRVLRRQAPGRPSGRHHRGSPRVDRPLRRHPLARALRMDKRRSPVSTPRCRTYHRGEAQQKVPVWRMIATPLDVLDVRAEGWVTAVGSARVDGRRPRSMIGGGSLPEESLPSRLLAIETPDVERGEATEDRAKRRRRPHRARRVATGPPHGAAGRGRSVVASVRQALHPA